MFRFSSELTLRGSIPRPPLLELVTFFPQPGVKMVDYSPAALALVEHISEVRRVLGEISTRAVERVVDIILEAHEHGRHLYILGNGGSASTSSHFACDISKATISDSRTRLRASALTDNVALLTAWANDTSYERVFAEQLLSLASAGDVVLTISASGNSPNVLEAARVAREIGARTVALVGFSGGALKNLVDVAIHVVSDDYGVVEDCHLVLEHAITASVRSALQA